MQLLDYSTLEESRAVFRTFFLGRALKESLTVQKALSASNSQRCNTFGTTVVSSVLFQDTAETEVKKKQQGWPIVQKFLMWKMFSNKKWVLNHVSGVEVSEEERCNYIMRRSTEKSNRNNYSLLNEELKGNHWNEHKTHLIKTKHISRTKWTVQHCHTPHGRKVYRG